MIAKFDEFARNVAVKTAKGLPRMINLSYDDCIQEAKAGLIEAARRFDGTKSPDLSSSDVDARFKSFAFSRIRGAVIDAARKATFVRRRGLEKGIDFKFVSVDAASMSEDYQGEHLSGLQLSAVASDPDLVIDFNVALKALTERERFIVLGLGAGHTGREIADELGVTESRVSQIAGEAKRKLTERMAA